LLTAPDNQRITLHSRSGGSADNIQKTYDPTTTPDLANLRGVGAQGVWTLTVVDQAAADVGTLRSWKLSLTLAESDPYRAASQPGLQIPDNNPAGVSDGVDITGPGAVREVRVTVDITHTYIGDLRVALRSPSGREVVLHARAGQGADNILQTYDLSKVPDLARFAGDTAAGRWTLLVADLAGRDIGKLNRWELRIFP
jgi:subtilisin-like proprotein convertase family protein